MSKQDSAGFRRIVAEAARKKILFLPHAIRQMSRLEFLAIITAYTPEPKEWDALFKVDAAPAWVCGQCGEPYFEEREVRTIQRLLSQLDRQTAGLASVA